MSDTSAMYRVRKHGFALAALALSLVLVLVFWSQLMNWFAGTSTGSKSTSVRTAVGEVSLAVAIEPEIPQRGKNTLLVSLARDGAPITGAELSVEVWMPAMGAMPEMRSKAEVKETEAGQYRASFELSMAGSWTATIAGRAGAQQISSEYGLTLGTKGLRPIGTAQITSPAPKDSEAAPGLEAYQFGAGAQSSLLAAFDAYEAIRAQLARDAMDGLPAAAGVLTNALSTAAEAEPDAPEPLRVQITAAVNESKALAGSLTLDQARRHFASISKILVALGGADKRLIAGRHVFECPMWDGFSQWIQPSEELENPYMGPQMLTCGSEQAWGAPVASAPVHVDDPSEIAHYTCPMHPWVKKADPGDICPVCSMELTPVTKEEITEGIIRIDRERRQAFGVVTADAEHKRLTVPVIAVGRVTYDETGLTDVTLKFKGWIERLYVEETGAHIKKGQALFDVYGPELFAAQHELILSAQQQVSAATESQRSRAAALLRGARKRFLLWDFRNSQIDAIIAAGAPMERLTVYAKAGGYIIEKHVVEGAAVEAGMRLFRIADLSRVWIEAEVYEHDLPLVRLGQRATVKLSNVANSNLAGVVSFIWPAIDPQTRAARVRIELANEDLSLRPEMFAEVRLEVERAVALVVPEPAIVYSGPRRIVFVDLGDDRLRPTLVEVGARSGGFVEILKGLNAGDKVVVSGNFLVAAESRLKSTTGIW